MSVPKHFQPGELFLDTDGVHINAHGGGVLLHDGVYYWFGEHKTAGEAGNRAWVGVQCYASRDLCSWQNRGIALAVSNDPSSDITAGCVIERPKVVYNALTKTFVMWFHLELKGQGYAAARTALAVADSPVGPYRFVRSLRPNAGVWPMNEAPSVPASLGDDHPDRFFHRDFAGGQMARDMTVFVDDDSAAYHVHASEENYTLHIGELTPDYRDFTGRYVRLFRGRQHEAPALFKRRGRYYLFSSACTGWTPNPARLSVADSIWGPWTELGNPCLGTPEQMATTFESQSTHVLPVAGMDDAFIFMADRWRPADAIDGRYVWLPIEFDDTRDGRPILRWRDAWDLSDFGPSRRDAGQLA